ncbi:O-antigen ligase family protein [Peribacillus sp. NPDC096622]|uniref:O-antigen ligase family protein n=1 Tax=Peribacillus sp. NPDC096622 TaxID=3364396 RepID=UPI00380DD633
MKKIAYWFLYIFIFTLPWEDMFVVSGLGAVSKISGFLFLVTSLIYIISRGYIYKINIYYLYITIFVFWVTCSFFWSINKPHSFILIFTAFQLFLMFLLMSQIVKQEEVLMNLLQSFVFGGWVSSIGIINSYFSNNNPYNERFSAGAFDPNELGIILVISITVSWYLSLRIKSIFLINVNRVYILLGAFAVFLTGSRTAFLALIASVIYILFLTNFKKGKKIGFLLKIILGFFLLYSILLLVPDTTTERILTTSSELSTGDFNSRQDAWFGGFELIKDNPILGVGIGSFRIALGEKLGLYMVAHNIYISVLGELGLVGFIILLIIIYLIIKKIISLNNANKYFLLTVWIIWFLASLTLTWEYSKITWLLFALVNIYDKMSNVKSNSFDKELK